MARKVEPIKKNSVNKNLETESARKNNSEEVVPSGVRGNFAAHVNQIGSSETSRMDKSRIARGLQGSYGNRYVNQVIGKVTGSDYNPVQAKLEVGAASDKYETEADSVAEQVVGPSISRKPSGYGPVYEDGGQARQKLLAHGLTHVVQQGGATNINGSESSRVQRAPGDDDDPIYENVGPRTAPAGEPIYGNVVTSPESNPIYENVGPRTAPAGEPIYGNVATSPESNPIYENVGPQLEVEQSTRPRANAVSGGMRPRANAVPGGMRPRANAFSGSLSADVSTGGSVEPQPELSVSDLLSELGFGATSSAIKGKAKDEYKKGEKGSGSLLTARQMKIIDQIFSSGDGGGYKILTDAGFKSQNWVQMYDRGGDYSDWETKIGWGFKLQVSTYQWENKKQNTPGFFHGQAVHNQDPDVQASVEQRDQEQWAATLTEPTDEGLEKAAGRTGEASDDIQASHAAATRIVKRVFMILQSGLRYHVQDDDPFVSWQKPVASALSHGGRVNIRIPSVEKGGKKDEFMEWIMGGDANKKQAGVYDRKWATHSLDIGDNEKVDGISQAGTGKFKETHGKMTALGARVGSMQQLGLDLPVGGLGETDINGKTIVADGGYGHLYIGYKPPTEQKDGGLLIGCETDAPQTTNQMGHKHTTAAKGAEFGPTQGAKIFNPSAKHGGMMVDLAEAARLEPGWLDNLKAMEQDVLQGNITLQELVGKRMDQLSPE